MSAWIATLTRVTASETPTSSFGPGIPIKTSIGGGVLLIEVTPRGYQNLTGRRAPRIARMHAAYRRKS